MNKSLELEDIQNLRFEITTHCNAKCPHCPRFSQSEETESTGKLAPNLKLTHLDIDKLVTNLELDKLINLKRATIQGDKGDPLMHPQIEKFIDILANKDGLNILMVNTNGSIRNATWWAKLAKKNYKNLEVHFSIDGLADTNHLYRVGLDYNTIIENIRAFIDNGGKAVWKFLVFKHNEHQVEEAKQLSQHMGFVSFRCQIADLNRFKGKSQWPVKIDGLDYFLEPTDKRNLATIANFDPTYEWIDETDTVNFDSKFNIDQNMSLVCPNLTRGYLYVTHDYQVVPCCMMHAVTLSNPEKYIEMVKNLDDNDLSKHNLSYIIKNHFFTSGLLDTFLNDQLHYICKRSCQNIIAKNLQYYDPA
jgi:sulfatase maturation enzyme AslB (radical SAM superfamily)